MLRLFHQSEYNPYDPSVSVIIYHSFIHSLIFLVRVPGLTDKDISQANGNVITPIVIYIILNTKASLGCVWFVVQDMC